MLNLIKKNKFIIFLFTFSFIIRLLCVLFIENPIVSDFKLMYDASLELLNGTNNYLNTTYFLTWGYQMGHVFYQYLFLRIINSVTFLKLINCTVTSLTIVYIYLISTKICNEKTAKISSLIYSIFLFPLLLNNVLTNQLLPALLILIAINIIINMDFNKYLKSSIIVGVLLAFSNILRSEVIVILFSIMLYFFILMLKKYNKGKIIASFIIILTTYFIIFNSVSLVFQKTNISINGLNNMNSTYKFVVGFNYETNGMYSDNDASLYANDKTASQEIVKERLLDYKKIPNLFFNKIKIQWFTSDLSWSLINVNSKTTIILNYVNKCFIILFNVLSLISIYKLINKKFNTTQMFISIILLVYFGVYLLIEVMPRYAYILQIFEAMLIGIGLEIIYSFYKKIKFTFS